MMMMELADELRAVDANEEERPRLGALNEALARAAVADHRRAYLVEPGGERLELPEPLFRVLRQAAALLSRGARVIVAPMEKEISTQEAADLLNVSRPFLVSLLDRGEIPSDKTGRYRRVRFGDVLAYKEMRNRRRAEILAQMMRENRGAGVYDRQDTEIPNTR
jgi:excisionase family DNA binding protein